MSCSLITGGILKDCLNNAGGVTSIYITDLDNLTGTTASGGTISAITMAGASVFYKFEFNKFTSSFEEATTINIQNGSTFYEQKVMLVIPYRNASKRQAIAELVDGIKNLAVIVTDSNGNSWLFGENEGLNVTELTGGSGVAKGDLNGYSITMAGSESSSAQVVTAAALAAVI